MKKEDILKFYQNYRLYIFPSLIAFSSLVLIIFVIYPQTIKLITNKQVEGAILNKSKLLEVKASNLESYDAEDLQRRVDFALTSYPTEKDFVSALGLLQNLTIKSEFRVVSISLGSSTQNGPGNQNFNIKLDVSGRPTELPSLLNNIENSPRLMRVSSMETRAGKEPQEVIISLSVDILYSSAPTSLGSIDAPAPELSPQEDEVMSKLARGGIPAGTRLSQPTTQIGPRGKENPFE